MAAPIDLETHPGWQLLLDDYVLYLQVQRGLSHNTVVAYQKDVARYLSFLTATVGITIPSQVTLDHLRSFVHTLVEEWLLNDLSQARNISAIRSFHAFLQDEGHLPDNPAELLELPRLSRKLPDTLTAEEVQRMLDATTTNTLLGLRNRTILEVMYGSGLRVSEVVNLQLPDLWLDDELVRVLGKGSKERLVPLSAASIYYLKLYLQTSRQEQTAKRGQDHIVFWNRNGHGLTRVMAFYIIRDAAAAAGLQKEVSPHTLRHCFATHLIEGGADLKAVQEMLGHESITTTEVYLHVDAAYLRSVHSTYHPRKGNAG